MCDARTVDDDDLLAVERRGADRTGELQIAMHQPGQCWYYYPRMNRDEVLLFKTYDSALDGRTRFTPHSCCKNPRAPRHAAPRESLETRCLVFF
ncbi:MAG: CmcJ/NvfI family oxidoreductase [Wenzhouxiangella sp.]